MFVLAVSIFDVFNWNNKEKEKEMLTKREISIPLGMEQCHGKQTWEIRNATAGEASYEDQKNSERYRYIPIP